MSDIGYTFEGGYRLWGGSIAKCKIQSEKAGVFIVDLPRKYTVKRSACLWVGLRYAARGEVTANENRILQYRFAKKMNAYKNDARVYQRYSVQLSLQPMWR